MNIFSIGQKTRMMATLTGTRNSLLSSAGCLTNGIENYETELGLKIYPNPANNLITVSLFTSNAFTISIFSMLGEKVLSKKIADKKEINIDCSDFSQGIYFVEIETALSHIYKKLQIIK